MNEFYAIIIGVGYDLPITVKDAKAIEKVLTDVGKAAYKPANVFCLTDEESSRENIIRVFDKVIKATAKNPKSTVVVFYSGHGGKYNVDGKESYYLMTYEYDEYDLENTMLSGKLFSEIIKQIPSDKLLVLLDCCHAAGIKTKDPLSGQDQLVKPSSKELLTTLSKGKGRVFISSCDDDEESIILRNAHNSLFTEVLVEALNGKMSEGEEYVSVHDLMYYITKQVPRRVPSQRYKQRPIISGVEHLSPDYYVCRNGSYSKVTAKALPFGNSNATDSNEKKKQMQLHFLKAYDNQV